jgi:alkylation response protein AidB-like acyl-CoA dehydrogenase
MDESATHCAAGGVQAASLLTELREWAAAHWNPELPLLQWRGLLVDAGWGCPTWPLDSFGRGVADDLGVLIESELTALGAVGPPPGFGRVVAAPTLLDCATEEQKRRYLRGIATGAENWCELFSEPGAGSDLAGVTTSAVAREGGWVVTGHKSWVTAADRATYGLLLARTDWDVPKRQGLTMFILPMAHDGVTVRSVELINGHVSHEVLLNAVPLSPADVVGVVGAGWSVAQTTLAHERRLSAARGSAAPAQAAGRAGREAAEEYARFAAAYAWIPASRGRADLLVERARRSGGRLAGQLVAEAIVQQRVTDVLTSRAASAAGGAVSPSLVKLASSRTARLAAATHGHLTGTGALLTDEAANPRLDVELSVHAASVIGGTDEIQRNVVAERVLGLPREPQLDAAVSFRDIPTNWSERGDGTSPVPHP